MNTAFEGIGTTVATFMAQTEGAGKVTAGEPVVMSDSGKVCACTVEGDVPAGVALSVRGEYAAVQISGYVKLPCAAGLTVGFQDVSVDGDGKLQTDVDGRGALVVDVDAAAGVCGVIL